MKKYEYMIIYVCGMSIGRCCIVTDNLIGSYKDLEKLDSIIKEEIIGDNIFITDFKLLREIDV